MLSAYLVSPQAIEIREVPLPEPGDEEIVVKIKSALTCGTDLKAYLRGHNFIPMPGPFGHEFSGIVHSVGAHTKGFRESDEIMSVHSAPCHACSYCARGFFHLCENIMTDKVLGAFGEYICIPSHIVKQNAFIKPRNISFDEAAMLEPLSCVVHPYNAIDLDTVERAVIVGAGPIGLLHLLFLKSKGIFTIVSDIVESRLEVAKRLRADTVCTAHDIAFTVNETTHGLGADLVVECTGQHTVWERSIDYVRRGGTVVLFGGCKGGTRVTFDTHRLHYDEIRLLGSFHFTPSDVKDAYDLLAGRSIDVSPLISGTTGLHGLERAFENLKNGTGIKYSVRL